MESAFIHKNVKKFNYKNHKRNKEAKVLPPQKKKVQVALCLRFLLTDLILQRPNEKRKKPHSCQ